VLKIRIYPDQLAVSRLEKDLSEEEFLDGRVYHAAIEILNSVRQSLVDDYGDERSALIIEQTKDKDAYSQLANELSEQEFQDGRSFHDNSEAPKAVWRKLSQEYRAHRAAWIVHQTEGLTSLEAYRDPDDRKLPQFELLPSFFLITLYPDEGDVLRKWSQVTAPLAVLQISEEGVFSGEAAWVADFEQAKAKGMAVEIDLSDEIKKINKITVVGLCEGGDHSRDLKDLLENHHYTAGAGFVKHSTPTNNSETASSGFSKKEDVETRYNQEFGEQPEDTQDSNADRLAWALGFDGDGKALLGKWQDGWDKHDYYTKDLHRALWRVTGDYFFDNFLNGALSDDARARLRKHFEDYIRPAGAYPTIRIGNLPYGVLPVTQIGDWECTRLDSQHLSETVGERGKWKKFDRRLHLVLMDFYDKWQSAVEDPARVPRVGDTQNQDANMDEELVKILAMSASGSDYSLRPYVDDRLIGWLLSHIYRSLFDYVSGILNPEDGAREWVNTWRELQKELAEFLEELGVSHDVVDASQLMQIIAWGDSKPLHLPLVYSATKPNDKPENYIPLLDQLGGKAPKNASETLLYSMLRRALIFETGLKPWKLLKRDQEETEQKILEFFNNAQNPEEIVDRIIDDPSFDLAVPRSVYGVRRKLAERIIQERDELEGKKFTGIEHIDAIRRVGVDTLQDIKFSFSKKLDPVDYEMVLKGVFDLFTHRLDAWISSLATKRLDSMRRYKSNGLLVGAYGFVENLPIPADGSELDALDRGGYIHAPSVNQATTAALLKTGFLTHSGNGNNPYRINLSSDRIRRALRILEGVREGQELGALLGYQFERDLHEHEPRLDQYKDEFRKTFPIVAHQVTENSNNAAAETVAARNVVNGLALIKSYEDPNFDLEDAIKDALSDEHEESVAGNIAEEIMSETGVLGSIQLLREAMDAVADLLLNESLYQVVLDNYERSSAAMDAAAGLGLPPEPDSLSIPLNSDDIGHRVCVLFGDSVDDFSESQPRESVEPRLATWFVKVLGEMSEIGCCVKFHKLNANGTTTEVGDVVTLDQLDLGPLDFLYLSANRPGGGETELEKRIKSVIRARHVNLVEEITVEEDGKTVTKQTFIRIDFGPYENNPLLPPASSSYTRCMDHAIEMSQQVLMTLSQAAFMRPELLQGPQEGLEIGFSQDDYDALHTRASAAYDSLRARIETVQGNLTPMLYLL
jgi:hypothetical protein